MKFPLNLWTEIIWNARESLPVTVDERIFQVFSRTESNDYCNALVIAGCNLVRHLVHWLMIAYPVDVQKESPAAAMYVRNVADYINRDEHLKLLQFPTTPEQTEKAIRFLRNFPDLTPGVDERVGIIHRFIAKVAEVADYRQTEIAAGLYDLAVEWMETAAQPVFHLLPTRDVLPIIESHVRHQASRKDIHDLRSISWGEEYDGYLQEFLAAGFKPNYAKGLARKKFRESHPAPVTSNDMAESDLSPGYSAACLRGYHAKYLAYCNKNKA